MLEFNLKQWRKCLYKHIVFGIIMQRMLALVPATFDRREGSIIWDALAPAAVELQLQRYLASFDARVYGGNIQDYVEVEAALVFDVNISTSLVLKNGYL
jgi:hypothetical protein